MNRLMAWKEASSRKPLILQGVRQTGKTYLLTQFGEQHFRQVHIVNFEKHPELVSLFAKNLDPKRIISELAFEHNTPIDINHDLVIFDEIQACPPAITSLKYFCEEMPELALCSAGSLLGLHLNDTSYPVGKVNMMHLHPMTFTEFLAGVGDTMALDVVNDYEPSMDISAIKHQRLWERLLQYYITGGLPEIVKLFRDRQDNIFIACRDVRERQHELIKAYYADIAKHSGKVNAMHIDRTWRAVPTQLAGHYDTSTNRFRFKDIVPTISRYRQLVNVIDWLEAAELVLRLPIVGAFEEPIHAYTKDNLFKLMLFDVGLLGAMNGLEPGSILNSDYGTYKGYFAENFIAQQLTAITNKTLYSWQEDRSEIEFLLQSEHGVIPFEVKAGTSTRTKSLEKYLNKYPSQSAVILSANPPPVKHKPPIVHLPLYFIERALDCLY
tara:strand:+ start:11321 stop:12637 length:1317 start_codon:yes stop_codon:yes gene_type:complete